MRSGVISTPHSTDCPRLSTTHENLLEFEIAPGNTGTSWNLVDAPGKFLSLAM